MSISKSGGMKPSEEPAAGPHSKSFSASKRMPGFLRADSIYGLFLIFASAITLLIVLAIIVEIALQSRLSFHTFGTKFFTGTAWDPVRENFSVRAFALGTLYTSFWALLIAVPISIGAAIFLSEIAPRWIGKPLGFFIELFAAVPSVIYGVWAILVLVPWVAKNIEAPLSESPTWGKFFLFNAAPNGYDFLSASLVLALMIIPIITGIARDVLKAVPTNLREASFALGSTKWETIRKVVVPSARAGIVGSIMLGLGRALGETMAVTMVIGNSPDFNLALFSPGYTMPSVIANEFTEAPSMLYRSALMEIALVLLIVAIIVNGLARMLVKFTSRSFAIGAKT